jgi:hypothetical protein
MLIDDLTIYRGKDYCITDEIIVRQPTLGEICDYGEQRFFSMIYNLTSVGADLKWQLNDIGVDYTCISDYNLFLSYISKIYKKNDTQIILKNLSLSDFELRKNLNTDELVLYDTKQNIIFDKFAYFLLMDILRKTYKLKRNDEIPANEFTKKILIEDAKQAYEEAKNKPYESYLHNLISAMVNSTGFKHDEITVFDMKIGAFMDSVKRIAKIKNAELLLQSGYSGYGISLKDINKNEINWFGEL